jgi:hypothetical protein
MDVAGGLYRELCDFPAWDEMFGSGGRAAAAVSRQSPGSTLHTYVSGHENKGVDALRALGVIVSTIPSDVAVAFAYFHPLSRPHIEPRPGHILQQKAMLVHGAAVLRFGFLEGDAVVHAKCAVYDPQTSHDPAPFNFNGSKAESLALVLNELELRTASGVDDLTEGAARLMQDQKADVVIAKGGANGALVFVHGQDPVSVPAYRSSRVFKIGTGDVFSALFALHWAERGLSPHLAADLASRSVSAYCSTMQLPLPDGATETSVPLAVGIHGWVLLKGNGSTIGRRFALEEARFHLGGLGVEVHCPQLKALRPTPVTRPSALLLVADGMTQEQCTAALADIPSGMPVVVLDECHVLAGVVEVEHPGIVVVDDFVTAVYFAAWASVEPRVVD